MKLSDLVNELFKVHPNEEIIKALKGEILIPKDKIPTGLANLYTLIKDTDKKKDE